MSSETTESDGLVPHLCAAFGFNDHSQINMDPLVLAVACFVKQPDGVSAKEMVDKGDAWFPERRVHTQSGEVNRMTRFVKTYPSIFTYENSCIKLIPRALYIESPHPCDELWYTLALHRLVKYDPVDINGILDELEVFSVPVLPFYPCNPF